MEPSKKPTLSFGFSKVKAKSSLVRPSSSTSTTKNFSKTTTSPAFDDSDSLKNKKSEIVLITGFEGNRIKTVHKQPLSEAEKANQKLVIPCQRNEPIFDVQDTIEKRKVDNNSSNNSKVVNMGKTTEMSADLNAIQALIKQSKEAKDQDSKDTALKIPLDAEEENEKKKQKVVDLPDYESVDLEKFGMAALRGMGWSEKTGIGLTNKGPASVFQPELRPKGMGLGAGASKQPQNNSNNNNNITSEGANLIYAKDACVQITHRGSRHDREYGVLVSFDDGLNRIMVKLHESGETISLLQQLTRLVTKSDYRKATEQEQRRGK